MTNLTKKINKLQEKRTWIRNAYQKFLEEWAESTKGEDVKIYGTLLTVEDEYHKYEYLLKTGSREIFVYNRFGDGEVREYSEESWSWNSLSISTIKKIIANLPSAIKEIENKIDEKTQEEKNIIFPKF